MKPNLVRGWRFEQKQTNCCQVIMMHKRVTKGKHKCNLLRLLGPIIILNGFSVEFQVTQMKNISSACRLHRNSEYFFLQ